MGMKRMPGQDFKYIFNELPVLWEINAPQRRMAFIPFIIEQRMADVPEVRPDLVGTPRFQLTFHPGHVTETLQYFIMGNGMFSLAAVLINGHLHPVFRVPPDVSPDRSFIFLHISPHKSPVQPLGRTVEELLGQKAQRIFSFGDDQQAGSIFINPVDKSYPVQVRFLIVLFKWYANAFTRVPSQFPNPGCTTIPASLSTTTRSSSS